MKKQLVSFFLSVIMVISLLPTMVYATSDDYDISITASKFSEIQYQGKDTLKLDFMIQTNNGAQVRGVQTALIAVDLEMYDILQVMSDKVYNRTSNVSNESVVVKDYSYTQYYDEEADVEVSAKNAFLCVDDKLLFTLEADFGANDVSLPENTSVMSVLLGLKEAIEWDMLSADSVRLATAAEAKLFNATGVVTIAGPDGMNYVYRSKTGKRDTLRVGPIDSEGVFEETVLELSGEPKIIGEAIVGETLRVDLSRLNDTEDIVYQWYADGRAIRGATNETYTLTEDEVGKEITVKITAAEDSLYTGWVFSGATDAVEAAVVEEEGKTDEDGKVETGNDDQDNTDQDNETDEEVFTQVAFADVAENAYYYDAVQWAVAKNITTGTSATTFGPNAACTRAQAVTFLWRAAGSPEPVSAVMPFVDVADGAYYYKAVLWAVENGITSGTSSVTFAPNTNCTRAQIVTFLWRAQNTPGAAANNPFTDVAPNAYYANAVLWAVENGITSGTSATTFSPNANCTRGQIVTFLWRCNK